MDLDAREPRNLTADNPAADGSPVRVLTFQAWELSGRASRAELTVSQAGSTHTARRVGSAAVPRASMRIASTVPLLGRVRRPG